MGTTSHMQVLALAVALTAGTAGWAKAEDVKIPDGELPPPAQAEPAKTDKAKCVTDDSRFWSFKGKNIFKVALTNTCETRQRCTVNVYITTARGPQKGRATLTLAKASPGQTAHKDYVMKVPEAGGMASVSRTCKAI